MTLDPAPAVDLAARRLAAGDRRARGRRWRRSGGMPVVAGEPAPQRPAGERRWRGARAARASVGVDRRRRARRGARRRRRATAALRASSGGDVAAGDRRRAAGAARRAPGCARSRGSALRRVGDGREPEATRTARASRARRRARIGWRGAGSHAGEPVVPAPRRRLMSTVSAWSSAVWPVARVAPAARRGGRRGPCLEVRARRDVDAAARNGTPIVGGERRGLTPPRSPTRDAARGRRGRDDVAARRRTASSERGPSNRRRRRTRSGPGGAAGGNVQRASRCVDVHDRHVRAVAVRTAAPVSSRRRVACGWGSAGR